MTPATMQALRRLLFLSTDEAARLVGGVTERTWRYWEHGHNPPPDDVVTTLRKLVAWRQSAITAARAQMSSRKGSRHRTALVWYHRLDDFLAAPSFGDSPAHWRPHCSVVAELATDPAVDVVVFDAPAYAAWLAGRADTEALRSVWAATVS